MSKHTRDWGGGGGLWVRDHIAQLPTSTTGWRSSRRAGFPVVLAPSSGDADGFGRVPRGCLLPVETPADWSSDTLDCWYMKYPLLIASKLRWHGDQHRRRHGQCFKAQTRGNIKTDWEWWKLNANNNNGGSLWQLECPTQVEQHLQFGTLHPSFCTRGIMCVCVCAHEGGVWAEEDCIERGHGAVLE